MQRLDLPDGQWIEVKDKQKAGDRKNILGYASNGISSDGKYDFNVTAHQIATAAVRIVNWSVKGEDGKPIMWPSGQPFSTRAKVVADLDEDTFDAISSALNEHLRALEAADADAKKDTGTGETN